MERIKFDIVGLLREGGHWEQVPMGNAIATVEAIGLTDKAKFMLSIERPPCNFDRTFLVPETVMLEPQLSTRFRVCDSMETGDGGRSLYGMGTLEPVRGDLCDGSFYYELVADAGYVLWRCGRFFAHLDPHSCPDYFTLSEAA